MKLDEIARLAGVSRTTASYVINGKAKQYRVSDKTVEKVMAVVREHNYQPNAVAAGLRAGRTRSIGLVIPDLENTSYTRIANHLERRARQHGYQLLIACSEDKPENEMRCVSHLLQRQVDALIVSTALSSTHEFYQQWAGRDLPIIALDRALDPQHFISVVGADRADAEVLCHELLSQPDVKSIVYVGALPELSVSQLREQGFRQACEGDKRQVTFLHAASYEREAAASRFAAWLKEYPLPDALFTTSFALLQGVLDEIIAHFGKIPPSLTIATFGDHELLDFLGCKVMSLSQRHRDVAETVLKLVLDSLDGTEKPQPGMTRMQRQLTWRGTLSRLHAQDASAAAE